MAARASVEETRRRILEASVALVAEEGVRGVSFREVARRAGVSHQAPYHHFGNHLGILRAIAQQGFAGLARAMEEAAAGAPDPLTALEAGGVAYVRFATTHPGHLRVMFDRALVELTGTEDPGVPPEPMEEADRAHQVLTELATAAHAAGHGQHLDPDLLATLCWSTVHGLATLLVEGVLELKGPLPPVAREALAGGVVGALAGLLRAPG